MAKDLIQVTHGLKADLPQLMPGEIGFCTDTEEAFIGNGDGNANIPLGAKGDKGDKGDSGTNGRDGTDGTNGVTFTPSVSADGTLSWTNDGGLNNPDPVNIKGETGASGSDATITVDSSLSSTSENPVANRVLYAVLNELQTNILNLIAGVTNAFPNIENLYVGDLNNGSFELNTQYYCIGASDSPSGGSGYITQYIYEEDKTGFSRHTYAQRFVSYPENVSYMRIWSYGQDADAVEWEQRNY